MAPVRDAETAWPVGFSIRPATDPQSPDVEVTDTVTGKRFRWSPESLSRYILHHSGTGDSGEKLAGDHDKWFKLLRASADRGHLVPGWRHWYTRGWHPSDQYYVASRRWDYADTTDPDGTIRAATVEKYLSLDGPPPEGERLDGKRLALGVPAPPGDQELSRLLVNRRSGRAYVPRPVPLGRLSGLLWYGLADVRERRAGSDAAKPVSYLDSYGSAWEFYLCVYNVAGIDPGVYRYEIMTNELTSVRPGDHREEMISILQGMRSPATAAWTLSLVADFPRYQWRYRNEHGLRRLYLEAGILAQDLLILAMSYGLSTLVTPAQKDRPYLALHDLPDDRFAPMYTLTMGLSRGKTGVYFDDDPLSEPGPGAP